VTWRRWPDWPAFRAAQPPAARCWFIEQGGAKGYHEVVYGPEDYLVFGRESAGLPSLLLLANRAEWLHIPMVNPVARSLNMSNWVSLVLFEALRQSGFRASDGLATTGG